MFSQRGRLARQLKRMEKNQNKMLKELEKLKEKKEAEELLESQGNSEEQPSWRDLLDSQEVKDALTLTKIYGLGAGVSYGHSKVYRQLSENQQKAWLSTLDTSFAVIEQQDNDMQHVINLIDNETDGFDIAIKKRTNNDIEIPLQTKGLCRRRSICIM